MFPFTFKFPVPDIVNPFAAKPNSRSPTPPVVVSRKRGRSSDGDTPTSDYHEVDTTPELPPSAKRRRGLAGSIVSTALSAALLGSAVGLTVYRLWRDRGKPSPSLLSDPHTATEQLPPPPPYQETERSPAPGPTSPKSPRKHRSGAGSSKRSYHRQRSTRARAHIPPAFSPAASISPTLEPATAPDVSPQPADEADDEMDWIGDKLSVLIAEGKRALGREIVVMSDSKDDEIDDGSSAWEDSVPASTGRSAGTRRRRSHTTSSAASVSTLSASQRRRRPQQPDAGSIYQTFSASTSSLPPPPSTPRRTHQAGLSLDSSPSARRLWTSSEEAASFESPELREAMERARQRALAMRAARSGDVGQ